MKNCQNSAPMGGVRHRFAWMLMVAMGMLPFATNASPLTLLNPTVGPAVASTILVAATTQTAASEKVITSTPIRDADLAGAWMATPKGASPSSRDAGVVLNLGGAARSFGAATYHLQGWRRSGDLLILSGMVVDGGVSATYTDTYRIVELSRDKNTLSLRKLNADGNSVGEVLQLWRLTGF